MINYKPIFFFFLLTLSFILVSCDTNEPPPPDNGNGNGDDKPKPKITLSVDDTSPTEVWLNLITENIPLPDTLKLLRNNDTVKTIELFDSNYVIYEDSLFPSQSYSYRAVINDTVTSEATAVTMDTTSHNFTYEVFEFGEHGNSVLRDVAIIDENNIWAVGAINMDSSKYNAMHWNGVSWEPQKVYYGGNFWDIKTVYAFSENEVWFSAFVKYDGKGFIEMEIPDVLMGWTVNKIWGNLSNDIYVVGSVGNIAHYNGTSWRRIESGTDLTLSDVYGNNYNSVYTSGVRSSDISGILLNGNQSGFSVVKHSSIIDSSQLFDQLYGELASVWVDEKGTVYTGGNLFYWQRKGEWNYVSSLPENILDGIPSTNYRGFISSIRGNASNDYIIAGERNTMRHFNGISWKQIGMPYDPSSPILWYKVAQKDDLIVAVGEKNNKAIIIKLKR